MNFEPPDYHFQDEYYDVIAFPNLPAVQEISILQQGDAEVKTVHAANAEKRQVIQLPAVALKIKKQQLKELPEYRLFSKQSQEIFT